MISVSRGFDSRSGPLIFPVFVLLLFPLRHIRVPISDDEPVVRNVTYVYYINKGFTSGPMDKLLDDQQK